MLLSSWIIYLIIGKILIYIWQQFPLPEFAGKWEKINKLHTCSLCSGVWIFTLLSFFGINIFQLFGIKVYIPIMTEIITGSVSSFIVFIFSQGWKYTFEAVIIK